MFPLEVIFFGILGLIVGSFLNVAVLRHNTGRSLAGRSGCLSCGRELEPLLLVPVLSWIFLRGRCKHCGVRIALQYPLVELVTGAIFAGIASAGPAFPAAVPIFIIAALLVAISTYDILHTIIPDVWVWSVAALSFAYALYAEGLFTVGGAAWIAVMGIAVALPLYALWLLTRGRGIGLGDAKLALTTGFLLGLGNGLIAVSVGFVLGAAVSLCILIPLPFYRALLGSWGILPRMPRATFTMKSEVPFGPFLVAGTLIVWFIITQYGDQALLALMGLAPSPSSNFSL